ncbi:MAG: Zeta toxin, partial [Pseudomonas sp.]|nr:Zeta toxin [Pseudomonas sp.]
PPEDAPLTVFMAGSPGAGKTEVCMAMKEALEEGGGLLGGPEAKVLRIDPDEFRCLLPGYTGRNSYLFQKVVTKILERVLDRAFEKKMSFILDGTMANLDVAKKNLDRVLRKGRVAQIMYVYQRPELAWKFVQAREITEGRNIPLTDFVRQYFCVRHNIKEILNIYRDKNVHVDLLIKNTDSVGEGYEFDVTSEQIDDLIPHAYDREQLLAILKRE